jgi:16S rRNA (guanine966-N2)-methyltransferase
MIGGLEGARVLDLYAGSGAVGLEALSRGAADAVLIESDPGAAQTIRRNIEALGLPGASVVQDKVGRALRRGPGPAGPRDFVFADPPYATTDDELSQVLDVLAGAGWVAAGALVVVERDARSGPPRWPAAYAQDRSRKYGETVLWYGRASGAAPGAADSTTGA